MDKEQVIEECRLEAGARPDKVCQRCAGKGYHHGFGEDGHDPDWCEKCGGAGAETWSELDVLIEKYMALLAQPEEK